MKKEKFYCLQFEKILPKDIQDFLFYKHKHKEDGEIYYEFTDEEVITFYLYLKDFFERNKE